MAQLVFLELFPNPGCLDVCHVLHVLLLYMGVPQCGRPGLQIREVQGFPETHDTPPPYARFHHTVLFT